MYNGNALESLKRLNVDEKNMEELVGHSMVARIARDEFEKLGMEVPEWLDDVTRKVRRAIHSLNADERATKLRQIDAALESMKDKTERKADLIAMREKLIAAGV